MFSIDSGAQRSLTTSLIRIVVSSVTRTVIRNVIRSLTRTFTGRVTRSVPRSAPSNHTRSVARSVTRSLVTILHCLAAMFGVSSCSCLHDVASSRCVQCRANKQKPSEEKQSEDGDDDGDHDDTDYDADDDAEIDVPQSDNYEHGYAEAAAVDEDTSDYSAHKIINCKGEANENNSVRCPLAVSCPCLSGVGRCHYQREALLFPCVLQLP